MGTRELRVAYGKTSGSAREAINRAIRAELVGGNEALDAMTFFHEMMYRLRGGDGTARETDIVQAAMDRLATIVNAMEREIRRRYEMK